MVTVASAVTRNELPSRRTSPVPSDVTPPLPIADPPDSVGAHPSIRPVSGRRTSAAGAEAGTGTAAVVLVVVVLVGVTGVEGWATFAWSIDGAPARAGAGAASVSGRMCGGGVNEGTSGS